MAPTSSCRPFNTDALCGLNNRVTEVSNTSALWPQPRRLVTVHKSHHSDWLIRGPLTTHRFFQLLNLKKLQPIFNLVLLIRFFVPLSLLFRSPTSANSHPPPIHCELHPEIYVIVSTVEHNALIRRLRTKRSQALYCLQSHAHIFLDASANLIFFQAPLIRLVLLRRLCDSTRTELLRLSSTVVEAN